MTTPKRRTQKTPNRYFGMRTNIRKLLVSSKDEVQAGFSKADAEQLALNNADFLGC